MDKIALLDVAGGSLGGEEPVHLLHHEGEKVAADGGLSDSVSEFLEEVRPDDDTYYLLVNAMGAHEYWGPNSNNDAWPEAGLCHLPPQWTGRPAEDRTLVHRLNWPYGLPTFYNGHAFAHHVNKDPAKRVGEIVYSNWNDAMKRVELVLKVERERLHRYNGRIFWEMLEKGDFPAVSMGSRVPWDRCSSCTDTEEFYHALSLFKPAEHAHPGIAVLRYHERMLKERGRGIRGIARRPTEYCDCMRYRAGTVDPRTGVKIFVFNDFPRFFDQSLVKRGADKTAYTMVAVGRRRPMTKVAVVHTGSSLSEAMGKFAPPYRSVGEMFSHERRTHGASLQEALHNYNNTSNVILTKHAGLLPAEQYLDALLLSPPPGPWTEGRITEEHCKQAAASVEEEYRQKRALARKRAEMDKDVEGKVEAVTKGEGDLPDDLLQEMSKYPLEKSLGTAATLGIVLRPREFSSVVLRKMCPGSEGISNLVPLPSRCPAMAPMSLSLLPSLLSALLPLFPHRSGFHAPLEDRGLLIRVQIEKKAGEQPNLDSLLLEASLPEGFLSKLGSLYRSYRDGLMELLPQAQTALAGCDPEGKVAFVHGPAPEDLFTPLSYAYFQKAFLDELSR